jgi:predicted O-linked N-acetylglucosamine transferase (SPINDLY family)
MGVPIVTMVGETVVGRAGLSQLTNLNLTDLIAYMADQYVQVVAALASDRSRLTSLRAGLRQRMQNSTLTNGPRFARALEAAYRQVWQRWCNSAGV